MRGTGERSEEVGRWRPRFGRGVVAAGKRWGRIAAGLGVLLGAALWLARGLPRHPPGQRRGGAPAALPIAPRTPFEVSFAQAEGWYVRAEVIVKQQLESLEEWDPSGIQGSAPEIYRRRAIARTGEIVRAEAAAHEALRQARTAEERYRAIRLLVHIERDMGHAQQEREAAEKLVALRPHAAQAALLRQNAEVNEPPSPTR